MVLLGGKAQKNNPWLFSYLWEFISVFICKVTHGRERADGGCKGQDIKWLVGLNKEGPESHTWSCLLAGSWERPLYWREQPRTECPRTCEGNEAGIASWWAESMGHTIWSRHLFLWNGGSLTSSTVNTVCCLWLWPVKENLFSTLFLRVNEYIINHDGKNIPP